MNFPKLKFPLTVDFGSTGYWINDTGPFQYGAAVTEFFCGNDLANDIGDGLLLMRRLEELLQAFGGHLHPYAQEWEVSQGPFPWLEEMSVESSVRFVARPTDGNGSGMAERWTVSCLRDLPYWELALLGFDAVVTAGCILWGILSIRKALGKERGNQGS